MYDRLAMYDSLQCSFLRIKKPPRQPQCPVCGPNATIGSMEDSEKASQAARGPSCPINGVKRLSSHTPPPVPKSLQINCHQYDEVRRKSEAHVLVDVRVPEQFDLCSLEGAVNIPLASLMDRLDVVEELSGGMKPVYCICRRGIASVAATNLLNDIVAKHPKIHSVKNIEGGLDSWREDVDSLFPKY